MLVGNHSSRNGVIHAFDLEGSHLYTFDDETPEGSTLFSIYGADDMMLHRTTGQVWSAGKRAEVLIFDVDGSYAETIYMENYHVEGDSILQLDDGTVVLGLDTTISWALDLLTSEGEHISGWGDNDAELKLRVHKIGRAPTGRVIVGGHLNSKGYAALLRQAGQLEFHSGPIEDFIPRWDIIAFGSGFLATSDQDSVVRFDANLAVVDTSFTGDKTGRYRGMMVLGGN